MTALITFATSPIGKRLLGALAVILALFAIYHAGVRSGEKARDRHYAALVAKAEKRVQDAEKKSAVITTKVEIRHAAAVEKIRTVTQTLIKEVPYAVPSDPARASLSVGFVRLHDAAATGVPGLSDPAGRSDAEASGVEDAALARTIIANYEACRINSEAVIAWQSWVTDQAALYNQTVGAKR